MKNYESVPIWQNQPSDADFKVQDALNKLVDEYRRSTGREMIIWTGTIGEEKDEIHAWYSGWPQDRSEEFFQVFYVVMQHFFTR